MTSNQNSPDPIFHGESCKVYVNEFILRPTFNYLKHISVIDLLQYVTPSFFTKRKVWNLMKV